MPSPPAVLPPYEVTTILRSAGLNPLHEPIRRGMTYVVRAVGASGVEMRVTVDARYGDIMAGYRAWLDQLPPKIAAQIANGNAKALFAAK